MNNLDNPRSSLPLPGYLFYSQQIRPEGNWSIIKVVYGALEKGLKIDIKEKNKRKKSVRKEIEIITEELKDRYYDFVLLYENRCKCQALLHFTI